MYRILSLALPLLILPLLSFSQGMEFFDGSWEEALQKSKEEGQPIFLDAYASWCGPCKRMARDVFPHERSGDYYNARFINMQIDMEKGNGPELAKKYKVGAYPTLLFISHDGEVIHRFVGACDVTNFLQLGAEAYQKYDKNAGYRSAYSAGNRDFETVYGYLLSLKKSNESTIKVANDFLRENPEINAEDRMKLTFAAASEADSKLFDEAIKNKKKLIKIHGKEEYEERMFQAVMNTVKKSIEYQYAPLKDEAISKIPEFTTSNLDLYTAQADMYYYSTVKDNDAYLKAVLDYYTITKKKPLKEQLILARQILQSFNTTQTRDIAMDIIKESWNSSSDTEDLLSTAQLCVQCFEFDTATKILDKIENDQPNIADKEQFKVLRKIILEKRG